MDWKKYVNRGDQVNTEHVVDIEIEYAKYFFSKKSCDEHNSCIRNSKHVVKQDVAFEKRKI